MFVYFDGLSGVFQPLISSLKSEMIPEKFRTTIMSILRIPINIFSIIILLSTHMVTTHQVINLLIFLDLFNRIRFYGIGYNI